MWNSPEPTEGMSPPPDSIRLGDPRFRVTIINAVPYLDLKSLGSGASSTVSQAVMLVPYGWQLELEQTDPAKPPKPKKGLREDGMIERKLC